MIPRLKAPFVYAAAMAVICALGVAAIAFSPAADAADPIKQSRSGICHCPGGDSYEATTRFTAFDTIEACLEADGRHPKRGQGECSPPVASIGDATTQAILDLRASIEGLSLRVAMLEAAAIEASPAPEPEPELSKVEAYQLCFKAVDPHSWSTADVRRWCNSIAPELMRDFVACFETEIPNAWSTSDAVKSCKAVVGA